MADGRTVAVLGSYAPSLVNFRGPLLAVLRERGHRVFALAPAIDEGTAAALRALGATPVAVPLANTASTRAGSARLGGPWRASCASSRPTCCFPIPFPPSPLARARHGRRGCRASPPW